MLCIPLLILNVGQIIVGVFIFIINVRIRIIFRHHIICAPLPLKRQVENLLVFNYYFRQFLNLRCNFLQTVNLFLKKIHFVSIDTYIRKILSHKRFYSLGVLVLYCNQSNLCNYWNYGSFNKCSKPSIHK